MNKFSKLKDFKVFGSKARLYWSQFEDAKIEAKQEGIDLGRQQGSIEIAKNLIGKLPIKEIAKVTKLSVKEIKKLQNK